MSDARPTVTPAPDGPYLVQHLERMSGASGALECSPNMALCRCGASSNKPFCDGAHARVGFRGAKVAGRTEVRRDDYVGAELTIHDNRGLCAHAGVCTDSLPQVWRMGKEPWIDPDGASSDEIVDVVRRCPSGALSVSRVEAGAAPGEAEVVVVPKGPYVLRGSIEVVGEPVPEGASPGTRTLCRCGASKNRPLCDGSHWNVDFDEDG